MIITDNFVMLNFPKTGTSFVRNILKKIHNYKENKIYRFLYKNKILTPTLKELYCKKIYDKKYLNTCGEDQHGCYRQIPKEDLSKTIVSIIRNPYTRYLSGYKYGWWRDHPPAKLEEIKKVYPHFPDLSFEEYFKFSNHFSRIGMIEDCCLNKKIGVYSLLFINFFSNDPDATISLYFKNGVVDKFSNIVFLKQENLNNELKNFLFKMNYSKKILGVIEKNEKVNVSKNKGKKLTDYYTQDILDLINEYDDYIFKIFPEYKVIRIEELSKFT